MPPEVAQRLSEAVSLAQAGQPDAARAVCSALVERGGGSRHPQPHFVLGVLASADGNHVAAEAHYRAALSLEPSHAGALTNLGQSLLATGRVAEAVPLLRRAASFGPLEARLNLASALARAGEHSEAAEEAARAAQLSPGSATALTVLGDVALLGGDASGAAEAAARAITAAARSDAAGLAAAWALRAAALAESGDAIAALEACAQSLLLVPDQPRARALRPSLAAPALRSGDVFIATFPKSGASRAAAARLPTSELPRSRLTELRLGTTWLQQIVCCLFGEPNAHVQTRVPWVEAAVATGAFSLRQLAALPHARRAFKTHAPPEGLPVAGCLAGAPPPGVAVVVVVRDPRDVAVSLYHHSRALKAVARVAGLLGVQPDGAALDAAVRASSFEAMRQRHEATDGAASRAMRHEGEAGHFRRGSPGGWREKFTPEQSRRFDAALRERLGGSGLEEEFFPPVTTGVAR
ncbi:hypothetical protein EMIHUDRAFT_102803 [Emiliania huxleyi CCMP1516]|uniref:Sulfotransferase domain-containing protein n=2 Tax=Emiliania huxleyi TaxID=2903 RepID=A0A0D3J018_EMIH1|nr:hypothetical protein EMIHUDRAFT_102803 [Emiliania huxleyi CCMP1516]EOD16853.1 hypothetical protein EMIHUDRAFT_102803 [Emiliania huxleyi CCMP1516]|eukprot:XP_005769282.1 hypothetical protein EMIHUDRAFT_102803 [Emiliania huxleyi CCMP1516]